MLCGCRLSHVKLKPAIQGVHSKYNVAPSKPTFELSCGRSRLGGNGGFLLLPCGFFSVPRLVSMVSVLVSLSLPSWFSFGPKVFLGLSLVPLWFRSNSGNGPGKQVCGLWGRFKMPQEKPES